MSQASIHRGSYTAIPADASPGLLFLKALLPELDSLGPFAGTPALMSLLTPTAVFIINGGPPIPARDMLPMFERRAETVAEFRHDVDVAWDVAHESQNDDDDDDNDAAAAAAGPGSGRRTVMYESTSVTVFRDDPERVEVRVREFNVVELVPTGEPGGGGGGGAFKAAELRAFLDGAAVASRAQAVQKLKGGTT
ncbi:cell wall biogenesis protein Mhp1 [Purpureocillium lavendulum]|uniref:Cell wall biogenesis protein Mhp1 n=1 Tax=Purpureocillium lavendulum TaxID=1247861 RepID=A0AB34FX81_9HYPO|nr:cell wall biogenesis protein Mhp1 [Purpureocillium lavendulum]